MILLGLGIIIGLLLAMIWIILTLKMPYKASSLAQTIQTSAKSRQKGEVIIPLDEVTQAREKMIKEKHAAGLDVYLDDIP